MKNKINSRLVGIAIIAVIATVMGITIIYYNLFQKQVRSDLSVSAKLLRDTHYFESVNIDIDEINKEVLNADISPKMEDRNFIELDNEILINRNHIYTIKIAK